MQPPVRDYLPMMGLVSLFFLAWLVYLPGLSGGFLFDDYINLDALGREGPITQGAQLLRYLTSGQADPTGRPLALLSFLANARDWPADPGPFLRFNLTLHLLNGGLLFALLRKLGNVLQSPADTGNASALLGSGLWLLHPLFVSTTLYVVQREAMLPATFTLLALLAYSHGRTTHAATNGAGGRTWMIVGIVGGTLLATLCKANGILVPLFAWVLEATVFRHAVHAGNGPAKLSPVLRNGLLVLPSLLVAACLGRYLFALDQDFGRPWTVGQRLLTEPRVLFDYLQLLIVPRAVSNGLYNDGMQFSSDILSPASTLLACIALLALIVVAFLLRRRAPVWTATILFFLAGHLLESSVVPLELYFEHRNYLPAMLLFWPVSRALCSWRVSRVTRSAIAVSVVTLLAFTTHERSILWGQPAKLSTLWVLQNPNSSRALATIAGDMVARDQPEKALALLDPAWLRHPDDVQIGLNYMVAACALRGPSIADNLRLNDTLARAHNGSSLVFAWLDARIDAIPIGECAAIRIVDISQWIDTAASNPALGRGPTAVQIAENLRGRISLAESNPALAASHFRKSLLADVQPGVAASQAAMLAGAGYHAQAMAHLDSFEQSKDLMRSPAIGMPWVHARLLEYQGYWPQELGRLRIRIGGHVSGVKPESPAPATESGR